MKVVLVQPPIQDFYDTDVRLQPIGLCYLKAAVRRHLPDIDIRIRDYHGGAGRQTAAIPKDLRYLAEFYAADDRSPFSAFHRFYHFGWSFDDIERDVADINPDVVGISALFTPYFREVLETAARVKRGSSALVVVGGSHASAAPGSLLSSPDVDYVIRGEGEKALVLFLGRLQQGRCPEDLPNLAYHRGGAVICNPVEETYPLDELPFPDLSDLPPRAYALAGKPLTFMITSRSCPHKCSFCSVHTTFGTQYRRRSIEKLSGMVRMQR